MDSFISPDNKSFCSLLWMYRLVDSNGMVRDCCDQSEDHGPITDWEAGWNDDRIRDTRRKMVAGIPIRECKVCYKRESMGQESTRTNHNRNDGPALMQRGIVSKSIQDDYHVDTSSVVLIELRLGSLCNLKCKMCNGHFSSEIRKDSAQLKQVDPSGYATFIGATEDLHASVPGDWYDDPVAAALVDRFIMNVHQVNFAGGEPTIIPGYMKFLQRCIDLGRAPFITISFCTNVTNTNKKFMDMLQEFRSVGITFSVDGIGGSYEYIRVPAHWSKIRSNMLELFHRARDNPGKLNLALNVVYQTLNMLDIGESLAEYVRILREVCGDDPVPFKVNIFPIQYPTMHRMQSAPEMIKAVALHRFLHWLDTPEFDYALRHGIFTQADIQAIRMALTEPYNASTAVSAKTLLAYTRFMDQNKKQKLEDKIPHLHRLLLADQS
jgi:hypothetical protein